MNTLLSNVSDLIHQKKGEVLNLEIKRNGLVDDLTKTNIELGYAKTDLNNLERDAKEVYSMWKKNNGSSNSCNESPKSQCPASPYPVV